MLQLVIDSGILPSLVNLLGHHEVNVVVSVFVDHAACLYKLLLCEWLPLVNDLPKFSVRLSQFYCRLVFACASNHIQGRKFKNIVFVLNLISSISPERSTLRYGDFSYWVELIFEHFTFLHFTFFHSQCMELAYWFMI